MRVNIKILLLIVAVLIIAAATSKSGSSGQDPNIPVIVATSESESLDQDPNIPDTISVDSVVASVSTPRSVPIYFYNDEGLGGLELTLTHDSPDIVIDSFSFAGGRVASFTLKGAVQLSAGSLTIYCFPLSEGLIPAGNGLLGNIYFSFLPGIQPQVDRIDSLTLIIGSQEYSNVFSDSLSNPFKPVFVEGYLDVQPGCCIGNRGNIDNDPYDEVNIADLVYLTDYMMNDGPEPVCMEEANVDGSPDEAVNIADLVYLADFMFNQGPPPLPCP